jgi:hypothetical protein
MKGIVMKKVIQKSFGIRKTGILSIVILMTVFCMCTFADIVRTWNVHYRCSDNVSSLTSVANSVLNTKDQDYDFAVCVTITQGSTYTDWYFNDDVDDDGKVLSVAESSAFWTAAYCSDKNAYRLVRWYVDQKLFAGWFETNIGIGIMDNVSYGGPTLAHEIGHMCGNPDITENQNRIMFEGDCGGNIVTSLEKWCYELNN